MVGYCFVVYFVVVWREFGFEVEFVGVCCEGVGVFFVFVLVV